MNDLNNRFFNFLNLVKCETKRSEYLQASLIDSKKQLIINSNNAYKFYNEELMKAKNYLNELCLSLSDSMVRERHHKILCEWFSSLLIFEQENSRLYRDNSFSLHKYPLNSSFDSSSESQSSENTFGQNLSNLSTISVSQTSLLSCSSSNSFPISFSSSCTSSASCTEIYQQESLNSSPLFSLETYLNNLNKNRLNLKEEYDRKYTECQELKENIAVLNQDLSNLNDTLDNTKLENLTLKENIKNLRKQISFHRNKKEIISQHENDSNSYQDVWIQYELDKLKKEICEEFEKATYEDLECYENSLKENFMIQVDKIQLEYEELADKFEIESNEILNDLAELNRCLAEDFVEYEQLREQNNILNQRLLQLSSNLCSFNSLEKDKQDKLLLNYSIKNLSRQIENKREEIKNLKQELNITKNRLAKIDALEFIVNNQQFTQQEELESLQSLSVKDQNIFLDKLFKKNKFYPFKLRTHGAKIETTKSNLFSFFVIKFDLIYHNYTNSNKLIKLNHSNSNSILNSLKLEDSIDGLTINIENTHKILDIDLSEWKLKREIYYTNKNPSNFDFDTNLSKFNFNCSSSIDCLVLANEDMTKDSCNEFIEYTFPKGFKLKRRKRISLIAAGTKHKVEVNQALFKSKSLLDCNVINTSRKKSTSINPSISSSSLTHLPESTNPKLTQIKCACCSCKMLIKRNGNTDFIEVNEVNNWGSGLLVVTKLVNSKNIIKLANYKFLKHIWLNNHEK